MINGDGAMKKIFLLIAIVCTIAPVHAQSFSADELEGRTIERRAIEAVNWGMPAVNTERMVQALKSAGGDWNQIVIMPKLQNWKNQTLTPNADLVYLLPFINTKDAGPMVLEIPPADDGSITGSIMDLWQNPLETVGPAGVDKGKGGKYLILPPNTQQSVPDGYIPLPSSYFENYALLRSVLRSGSAEDLAKAVAYAKRIKLYPLAQAGNPPMTKFVDVSEAVFDASIPYDVRFFESLDRTIQSESWLDRDKAMIDVLRSIGIEKGKPFNPDSKTREILDTATREARAWLNLRFETSFPPYYDDKRWVVVAPPEALAIMPTRFEKPDRYSVDARGLMYYYAFASEKHLGGGSFYLFTLRDSAGNFLDGGKTYRVTVPANVPVKQYWSAVPYDRATHTFFRDVPYVGVGSQTPGLQTNSDGSVDLTIGPTPPSDRASNWIPTRAGSQFEFCIRFYGPEKPLFDKTWKLPDIEKVE